MLFNSLEFISFFIVLTVIYFLVDHRYRWFIVLAASCYFYMAFVPIYILILFGTIIVDYWAGIIMENMHSTKRKTVLIASLVSNIGVLAVFKYYNFFIENINTVGDFRFPSLSILLPIGLSFHTFQAMSYTIEVYRGNQKAERHLGIYALYVMFYPQLVAGPIERPQNMLHQFHEKKNFDYCAFISGLKLMAWGMFKKVVVADRLAIYVNQVFDNYTMYEGIPVIIAVIFFSLQIYFDFSSYSDIAIGSAKTMGFDLMTNFRTPYFSNSVSEFWTRWHISLSTWFRDYLYIPLGGNRVSERRTKFNQFFVFLVSGLWHGANWTYIFWGFLHGIYVSIENSTKGRINFLNKIRGIKRLIVLVSVALAWIFFRANSIHQAIKMIYSLPQRVIVQTGSVLLNHNLERLKLLYVGKDPSVFIASLFLCLFVLRIEWKHRNSSVIAYFSSLNRPIRYILYLLLIYGTILFGVFGKNQFIYFQF